MKLIPCKKCDNGYVPIGENFVTPDMASDAQDASLVGQSLGIEWGACDCCDGVNNEECITCTLEEKDAALQACLDWLEKAPFDYSNGNTWEGTDEGNVLGWRGHGEIIKQIKNALGIEDLTHPLPPDPPLTGKEIPF